MSGKVKSLWIRRQDLWNCPIRREQRKEEEEEWRRRHVIYGKSSKETSYKFKSVDQKKQPGIPEVEANVKGKKAYLKK